MVCFITRFVLVQLLSVGVFSSNPEGSAASNWEDSDRPFDFGEVLRALRAEVGDDDDDDGPSALRLLTASTGPTTAATTASTNTSNTSNTSNTTSSSTSNSTNSSASGHKLKLELSMDVTDPTAYVAAAATHTPVIAQGIASTLSVQVSAVSVTLTVATRARRLSSTAMRRLTTSYVKIEANVTVATAAAATALKTTSDAKTAAQFMTAVTAAYTTAGVTAPAGLNVTTGATSTVIAPATTTTSSIQGGQANGATQTSFSVVPLFAVSAWFISRL